MRVFAPGRVNLIGDHVDYVGGVVLPMAIDLGTTIELHPGADRLELRSDIDPEVASLDLPVRELPDRPGWARYVAAVARALGATTGGRGRVTTTLPVGAGLSSSASLEVAVALALGAPSDPVALARLCQEAEHEATGVPTGIMDQLAIVAGEAGSAVLIDCHATTVDPRPLPPGTVVHAVHSGVTRRLEGSAYGDRRRSCAQAEAVVGPLRSATVDDLAALDDPVVRRRARHVVTEIARVRRAAATSDPAAFGALMDASHESLRADFEVSIPELDDLVAHLRSIPGVHGARLTGAGFGGCAVALVDESVDPAVVGGWRLRPSGGARILGR